jgi:hypothetical protein
MTLPLVGKFFTTSIPLVLLLGFAAWPIYSVSRRFAISRREARYSAMKKRFRWLDRVDEGATALAPAEVDGVTFAELGLSVENDAEQLEVSHPDVEFSRNVSRKRV